MGKERRGWNGRRMFDEGFLYWRLFAKILLFVEILLFAEISLLTEGYY